MSLRKRRWKSVRATSLSEAMELCVEYAGSEQRRPIKVLTASAFGLIGVTGQATWARVVNGNGDIAFDCDVTDTAGNGVIQLESTQLYAGGKAFLTALNLG
ncbi:hypothetical protein [Undibacterium sp. TC9W]|uniref:hypothetical protein n=1 Tax=Undibacterium sp. TC9W TaxID=3413053 RepID=UPI003BEF8B41